MTRRAIDDVGKDVRRIPALVVLVAVLQLPFAGPVTAHVGACAGQGTMTVSNGFGSVVSSPPQGAFVGISLNVGVCPNSATLLEGFGAFGWIVGWCDLAYGYGTTSTGHDFSFTILSNRIVFTGEVTGEMNFVEDPLNVGSCIAGTETWFFLNGAVALVHDVPAATPPMETLCAMTTAC